MTGRHRSLLDPAASAARRGVVAFRGTLALRPAQWLGRVVGWAGKCLTRPVQNFAKRRRLRCNASIGRGSTGGPKILSPCSIPT